MKQPQYSLQTSTEFDPHQYEADFVALYLSSFVDFHLPWTIFFVSHLSRVRRHFDDLEDALLLSAFGLNPLIETARSLRQVGNTKGVSYDDVKPMLAPTNAVRLSDLTGIPRETVRRKLIRFRQKGWIEQDAQGAWVLKTGPEGGASIAMHFKELNSGLLRDLAKLLSSFEIARRRLTLGRHAPQC